MKQRFLHLDGKELDWLLWNLSPLEFKVFMFIKSKCWSESFTLRASAKLIMDFCNCSRQGALNALDRLTELDLIEYEKAMQGKKGDTGVIVLNLSRLTDLATPQEEDKSTELSPEPSISQLSGENKNITSKIINLKELSLGFSLEPKVSSNESLEAVLKLDERLSLRESIRAGGSISRKASPPRPSPQPDPASKKLNNLRKAAALAIKEPIDWAWFKTLEVHELEAILQVTA